MVPGVLLEPYMSQGDQGVAETPIVSKGLIHFLHACITVELYPNYMNYYAQTSSL